VIEPVHAVPDPQKRLLYQVLRHRLVADHSKDQGKRDPAVAAVQFRHGLGIAVLEPPRQVRIFPDKRRREQGQKEHDYPSSESALLRSTAIYTFRDTSRMFTLRMGDEPVANYSIGAAE
jgi:hypothetical protein